MPHKKLCIFLFLSREKIRPEKELQRAKQQILKCKLAIREAVRQLDSLGAVGCIEESAVAPDGSVYHEHVRIHRKFTIAIICLNSNTIVLFFFENKYDYT